MAGAPAAFIPIALDLSDVPGQFQRMITQVQRTANRPIRLNIDFQPLGKISNDVKELEKSLAASNARVIAFGATTGVIYGMARAFSKLTTDTISVQKNLIDLNSILGVSQGSLSKFSDKLFDIAKNTAQSFDEVASAAKEFARQGLPAQEVLKRTSDAMIFMRTAGIDATDAVKNLTAATNNFQKEALNTSIVINKLTNVDTKFAASQKDLSDGIQRSAASAESAKLSFDELLGVIAGLQQKTQRGGAVIGNALKSILTRTEKSSTLESLRNLGVEIEKIPGQTLPSLQILTNLAEKYKELSEAQKAQIAQQLGGVYQINITKTLLSDLGSKYSTIRAAIEASTSATDEAIKRNEDLNQSLDALTKRAGTNITQLFSKIGEVAVAPALKDILGVVNKIAEFSKSDSGGGGEIGKGILSGIGAVLGGPGALAIVAVLGKTIGQVSSYAAHSIAEIAGLNKGARDHERIQKEITAALSQGNAYYVQRYQAATSVRGQEEALLKILQLQSAERLKAAVSSAGLASAPGISSALSRGSSVLGSPAPISGIRGAAGGLLPTIADENRSISLGVGGASASASAVVIPNFNFGKGKRGIVVANTDEYAVPNYANTGGTAIFNRDMVSQMGLPSGAKRISAAGGLVPNFANYTLQSLDANPNISRIVTDSGSAFLGPYGKGGLIRGIRSNVIGGGGSSQIYEAIFEEARKRKYSHIIGETVLQGGEPKNPNSDVSKLKAALPQIIRGRFGDDNELEVGNSKFHLPGGKEFDKTLERIAKHIYPALKRSGDVTYTSFLNSAGGFVPNFAPNHILKYLKAVDPSYVDSFKKLRKSDPQLAKFLRKSIDQKNPEAMREYSQFMGGQTVQITPRDYGLGTTYYSNLNDSPENIRNKTREVFTKFEKESPLAGGYIPNYVRYPMPSRKEVSAFWNDLRSQGIDVRKTQASHRAMARNPGGSLSLSGIAAAQYNSYDAIVRAIRREKRAGLRNSQIRVEQSSELRSAENPSGLAVTNTRDEPSGVGEGIRRARREGANPRTYGASRGLVPNFAVPLSSLPPGVATGLQSLINILKTNAAQDKANLAKQQALLEKSLLIEKAKAGAGLTRVENDKLVSFLSNDIRANLGISKSDIGALKGTIEGRQAIKETLLQPAGRAVSALKATGDIANQNVAIASFFDKEGNRSSFRGIGGSRERFNSQFGNRLNPDQIRTVEDSFSQLSAARKGQRNQRLFQASFAIPFLSGVAPSLLGVDPESRAGRVSSSLASGLGAAGAVASIGGRKGLGVAAGIAALTTVSAFTKNVAPSLEKFIFNLNESAKKAGEQVTAVASSISAIDQFSDLLSKGGSTGGINRAGKAVSDALGEIKEGPEKNAIIKSLEAGDTDKIRDILGQLGLSADRQAKSADIISKIENNIGSLPAKNGIAGFLPGGTRRDISSAFESDQSDSAFGKISKFFSKSFLDASDSDGARKSFDSVKPEALKAIVGEIAPLNFSGVKESDLKDIRNRIKVGVSPSIIIKAIFQKTKFAEVGEKLATRFNDADLTSIIDQTVKKIESGISGKKNEEKFKNYAKSVSNVITLTDGVLEEAAFNLDVTGIKRSFSSNRLITNLENGLNLRSESISDIGRSNATAELDLSRNQNQIRDSITEAISSTLKGIDIPREKFNDPAFAAPLGKSIAGIVSNPNSIYDELVNIEKLLENFDLKEALKEFSGKRVGLGRDLSKISLEGENNKTSILDKREFERRRSRINDLSRFGGNPIDLVNEPFDDIRNGFDAINRFSKLGSPIFNGGKRNSKAEKIRDADILNDASKGILDLEQRGFLAEGLVGKTARDSGRGILEKGFAANLNAGLDTLSLSQGKDSSIAKLIESLRGNVGAAAKEKAARALPSDSTGGVSGTLALAGKNLADNASFGSLLNNTNAISDNSKALAELTKAVGSLKEENYAPIIALKDFLAPFLPSVGKSDVPSKAGGHIPNFSAFAKELSAIKGGVGGARVGDRPVVANVAGLGTSVLNSGESLIKNFLGSGNDAVFNRNMKSAVGGNLSGFGNVVNLAGGFVPNFAKFKGVDIESNAMKYLVKDMQSRGIDPRSIEGARFMERNLAKLRRSSYGGEALPGSNLAYVNRNSSFGSVRETIAHESFHGRFKTLGQSETLARFYGGYAGKKGNIFSKLSGGTRASYDFLSQNSRGQYGNTYDPFSLRKNVFSGKAGLKDVFSDLGELTGVSKIGRSISNIPSNISNYLRDQGRNLIAHNARGIQVGRRAGTLAGQISRDVFQRLSASRPIPYGTKTGIPGQGFVRSAVKNVITPFGRGARQAFSQVGKGFQGPYLPSKQNLADIYNKFARPDIIAGGLKAGLRTGGKIGGGILAQAAIANVADLATDPTLRALGIDGNESLVNSNGLNISKREATSAGLGVGAGVTAAGIAAGSSALLAQNGFRAAKAASSFRGGVYGAGAVLTSKGFDKLGETLQNNYGGGSTSILGESVDKGDLLQGLSSVAGDISSGAVGGRAFGAPGSIIGGIVGGVTSIVKSAKGIYDIANTEVESYKGDPDYGKAKDSRTDPVPLSFGGYSVSQREALRKTNPELYKKVIGIRQAEMIRRAINRKNDAAGLFGPDFNSDEAQALEAGERQAKEIKKTYSNTLLATSHQQQIITDLAKLYSSAKPDRELYGSIAKRVYDINANVKAFDSQAEPGSISEDQINVRNSYRSFSENYRDLATTIYKGSGRETELLEADARRNGFRSHKERLEFRNSENSLSESLASGYIPNFSALNRGAYGRKSIFGKATLRAQRDAGGVTPRSVSRLSKLDQLKDMIDGGNIREARDFIRDNGLPYRYLQAEFGERDLGALSKAIQREKDSLTKRGVPRNLANGYIFVGSHPSIGGLGVGNTLDENLGATNPNAGILQGINRVKSEGGNPRTSGVPNFASTGSNNESLISAIKELISAISNMKKDEGAGGDPEQVKVDHLINVNATVNGKIESANKEVEGVINEALQQLRERLSNLEKSQRDNPSFSPLPPPPQNR